MRIWRSRFIRPVFLPWLKRCAASAPQGLCRAAFQAAMPPFPGYASQVTQPVPPGAKVSQGLRDSFWLQGMQASLQNCDRSARTLALHLDWQYAKVGYLLDSGNRSGIGLVGRSPWTAADASSACWQAGQGPAAGEGARPTSLHRTRAT